ncbi:MAG: hypothetical protein ACKVW3_14545 [Phycisphaerales bacterium]
MRVFDSPEAAWRVVPDGEQAQYDLYGYRVLTTLFGENDARTALHIPEMQVSPMRSSWVRLGWDVPEWYDGFCCSPLSCNHLAEILLTNRHCLIDEVEDAEQVAKKFHALNAESGPYRPEPGPYCLVEVWRERAEHR